MVHSVAHGAAEAAAAPGSLLEMQTPTQPKRMEPESPFYQDPQGDTFTLKLEKHQPKRWAVPLKLNTHFPEPGLL